MSARTIDLTLAETRFEDFQKAIRDQFQTGGSLTSVLLVLAGLAGLVLLVHLLTLRQEQAGRTLLRNDPHHLFVRLIDRLKLPPLQREALGEVVRATQLAHPAVLLLSEDAFDQSVDRWAKARPEDATLNQRAVIGAARKTLFPQ